MQRETKRVCIFVDGENFRHSIVGLFATFNPDDYLPKSARWSDFFNWIAKIALQDENHERVRTYWYVVAELSCLPYRPGSLLKQGDVEKMRTVLSRDSGFRRILSRAPLGESQDRVTREMVSRLRLREASIRNRFDGWKVIQSGIEGKHRAVEFRRAGTIMYDLFNERFQAKSEKGVDVKLATDLQKLKDIYDVAVIVSGDQDYVPAVEVLKDFGKSVVNIAFRRKDGKLLPGGAARLNQATDWSAEVTYEDIQEYLDIEKRLTRTLALPQSSENQS